MRSARLAVLALALALPACGSKGDNAAITIHPVTGTVKLANGQPVRGASIRLMSKGTAGGADGTAFLRPDGTFALKTMGDREGMMPGVYKVVINPNVPTVSPSDKAFGVANIPKKYWSEDSTDLEATVKDGDNTFEWTLK